MTVPQQDTPISLITPTVVVSLGGFGKDVLMRVRRMAAEHYGKLAHLPFTQFLHIDTDSGQKDDGPGGPPQETIALAGHERIDLSRRWNEDAGFNPDSLRQNPAIQHWLPPGFPIARDLRQGAGGLRPMGRLAFQFGIDDFRCSLQAALRRASDPWAPEAFQRRTGREVSNSISVLLICSLMGGTGSGCFLEAAYNIRHVLQTLGYAGGEVVGFLIIGASGMTQANKANCYGALKELEYYSTGSSTPGHQPFKSTYPAPGRPALVAKDRPFTTCYLLNHINSAGIPFAGENLAEKVARHLFVEITQELAPHRGTRRMGRVYTAGPIPIDSKQKPSPGFATVGLSTIEFPARRIQDMLANRLAAHAAHSWLYEKTEISAGLEARVADIVGQFALSHPLPPTAETVTGVCRLITNMAQDPALGPRNGLYLIEGLIRHLRLIHGGDLLTGFERLLRSMEQYLCNLRAATQAFARKCDRLREQLLAEPIAPDVHLTRKRLAELERQILPDLDSECPALLAAVEEREGALFPALAERFEQTCEAIFATAQARCAGARRLSIAQELGRAQDLSSILTATMAQGAPLLRLKGTEESSHFGVSRQRWIATAAFERDPHSRRIVDVVKRSAPDILEIPGLADPSRILYAEEVSILHLRSIPFLPEYRFCYQALEHHGIPRETDRRVQFPDLLPPAVNHPAIRRRARMHYVLGRVFGFLREQGNVQTGEGEIALTYLSPEGERMYSRIADRWDRVEQELSERQEQKELRNYGLETPLEILERLLADHARRARYQEQREALWRRTQAYLEQLKAELDGGESHAEYIRQFEHIADFWGDRQLLTGGNYASYNEAAYGRLVRMALAEWPNPDAAWRARKIQDGMVTMGLTESRAERIFEEQSEAMRAAGLMEYREAAEMVATFGTVTEAARDGLSHLQKECGLTDDEAHAVESPFFAPLYRREVERSLATAGNDPALERARRLLGITEAEAREIERQVRESKPE